MREDNLEEDIVEATRRASVLRRQHATTLEEVRDSGGRFGVKGDCTNSGQEHEFEGNLQRLSAELV